MKTKLNVLLLVLFAILFQSTALWAADLVKVDTNKKTVDSAVTDYGDSKQAVSDVKRLEAKPTLTGVGYTPILEGNPVPRPTTTVDVIPPPLPQNVRKDNRDMCPPQYYCVVPHGSMLLATCLLGMGASSDCNQVAPRCLADDRIRQSGGTLDHAEGDWFDHNCKVG